jgi:hypothetical protein
MSFSTIDPSLKRDAYVVLLQGIRARVESLKASLRGYVTYEEVHELDAIKSISLVVESAFRDEIIIIRDPSAAAAVMVPTVPAAAAYESDEIYEPTEPKHYQQPVAPAPSPVQMSQLPTVSDTAAQAASALKHVSYAVPARPSSPEPPRAKTVEGQTQDVMPPLPPLRPQNMNATLFDDLIDVNPPNVPTGPSKMQDKTAWLRSLRFQDVHPSVYRPDQTMHASAVASGAAYADDDAYDSE